MATNKINIEKGSLKPTDNLFRNTGTDSKAGNKQPTEANTSDSEGVQIASNRKSEERVTAVITKNQRDLLDNLTRKIQRQRSIKSYRFTRNDLFQSLVNLLNEDDFSGVVINTPEELESYLNRLFRRAEK